METRGAAWPMAMAAAALVLAGLYPIDNPDTFGHLAAGRQIAELGHVPSHDTLSFFRTESQPWVNYEWLSGLVFYGTYALGGDLALSALKAVLLALLAMVLVRRAYEREGLLGAFVAALLLVLATAACRYRFSVRPQLFGMLLSGVYLLLLTRLAETPERAPRTPWRWVFVLGALHVLWVNLHGSHLLGLLMSGIVCAASLKQAHARGPLAAVVGLQLLASCVSPYGPRIVLDAVAHVFDPAYREIVEEWQSWSADKPLWLMVAVVLQCGAMLLSLRRLRPDALRPATLAVFALLAVMALRSLRFIPDFLLLSSPLLAEALAPALRGLADRMRGRLLVLASALVLVATPSLALTVPPGATFGAHVDTSRLPAAIGGYLEHRAPGARVLGAMEDSWYLMFAAPSARFLIDGRSPFYGPAHLREVVSAWAEPSALRRLLDRYAVDAVVVEHTLGPHQIALRALEAMPDFHLVLIEDRHALFLRELPARAAWLPEDVLHGLRASYDVAFVLDDHRPEPGLRAEIEQLGEYPNTRAYTGFVEGALALRPLARAGGRDGFEAPRSPSQQRAANAALASLRSADELLKNSPVVQVHHALAAVLACQLDEAERVLARTEPGAESRETLLATQELLLRRGRIAEVRAFLDEARRVPELTDDGWLAALTQSLASPPRCP